MSIISARREYVDQSYRSAKAENDLKYLEKDPTSTAEYIFQNQKEDAFYVVSLFYEKNLRIVSIQKKTKVGADGFMIELLRLMATHADDDFVIPYENVRIITGMNNCDWERDMIKKSPTCFKDKIMHHGKLSKTNLTNIKNSLIIIDEIDSGDKEGQVLHETLLQAGILDVKHMTDNNNRIVVISATMLKELYDLYQWGELHEHYVMTIPPSYVGHVDFLQKGIVQEFYPLDADRWIQEDILNQYERPCMCIHCNPEQDPTKKDYRVHIIRVKAASLPILRDACVRRGILFKNHTSTDKLTKEDYDELFKKPLTNHIVVFVKGLFRRANLIPNSWKIRIGSTFELYTKKVDNNVQIQGLPGRMTGYWREIVDVHKTGPYRTSIKAIEEYETNYKHPFGSSSYQCAGFHKGRRKIRSTPTMLSAKNIQNLVPVELPQTKSILEEFETMDTLNARWKEIKPDATPLREPRKKDGRYVCSIGDESREYTAALIRETLGGPSMSYWGEGFTSAKSGDTIHRLYAGYEVDVPRYFLRWAIVR